MTFHSSEIDFPLYFSSQVSYNRYILPIVQYLWLVIRNYSLFQLMVIFLVFEWNVNLQFSGTIFFFQIFWLHWTNLTQLWWFYRSTNWIFWKSRSSGWGYHFRISRIEKTLWSFQRRFIANQIPNWTNTKITKTSKSQTGYGCWLYLCFKYW